MKKTDERTIVIEQPGRDDVTLTVDQFCGAEGVTRAKSKKVRALRRVGESVDLVGTDGQEYRVTLAEGAPKKAAKVKRSTAKRDPHIPLDVLRARRDKLIKLVARREKAA